MSRVIRDIPDWWWFGFWITLIIIIFTVGYIYYDLNSMPKCAEDVVIVGGGDYINGRWDYYSCGPARGDLDGS